MSNSKFVYVTYIRTTPEKVWEALTTPEFTRVYWYGYHQETTWERGSSWKLVNQEGKVADSGEIIEADKPRKMVIRWRNDWSPDLHAEGFSTCTIDLEPDNELVKLTVTHEIDKPESEFIKAVSGGWPKILSSLKSLLETGNAFEATYDKVKK